MKPRRTHFTLVLLVAVGAVHAQVTSPEPFGGRPFGSPPGTPSLQQQRQEQLQQQQQQQQQQQAAAAPTVVQVVPPAPPPQAQTPPTVGPGAAMQASRTTGQVPGGAAAPPQAMPAAPPSQPVNPTAAAPAPGTLSPPFSARNAPPSTAASAPATTTQLPVKGLPGDAPKLVITGSVFSPNPKNRFLIVNGQPFREGADLGDGLVLQEVHKESAVLGYKGARYNVMF